MVKVAAGTKRKRGHTESSDRPPPPLLEEELVLEAGEDPTEEDRELALHLGADEVSADGGQEAHDDRVVKTLREKAISEMAERGIQITTLENTQALSLFPKVSPSLSGIFFSFIDFAAGRWPCQTCSR